MFFLVFNRSIAKVIFMIPQTLTARRFEIASLTFAITLMFTIAMHDFLKSISLHRSCYILFYILMSTYLFVGLKL